MDEQATKRDLAEAVSKLVTKDEFRSEVAKLATKDELRSEVAQLRGEMREMKDELRGEIRSLRTELIREIGVATSHVANVMIAEVQRLITVVDEKYKDLPPAHTQLRADFEAHAADDRIHTRAPAPLPRRARRSRSS